MQKAEVENLENAITDNLSVSRSAFTLLNSDSLPLNLLIY